MLEVLPRPLLHILLDAIDSALCDGQVGQDQFVLHRAGVAGGIDGFHGVRHVFSAKRPDDVQ